MKWHETAVILVLVKLTYPWNHPQVVCFCFQDKSSRASDGLFKILGKEGLAKLILSINEYLDLSPHPLFLNEQCIHGGLVMFFVTSAAREESWWSFQNHFIPKNTVDLVHVWSKNSKASTGPFKISLVRKSNTSLLNPSGVEIHILRSGNDNLCQ